MRIIPEVRAQQDGGDKERDWRLSPQPAAEILSIIAAGNHAKQGAPLPSHNPEHPSYRNPIMAHPFIGKPCYDVFQ